MTAMKILYMRVCVFMRYSARMPQESAVYVKNIRKIDRLTPKRRHSTLVDRTMHFSSLDRGFNTGL